MFEIMYVTKALAFLMLIFQIFSVYLAWKMYKFSRRYSKQWSKAWLLFFVVMFIGIFRRATVITWAFGIDGHFAAIVQWLDHVVISAIYSVSWPIFLILLLRWWKIYFTKYQQNAGLMVEREDMVTKREDVATEREGLASKRETDVQKKEIA